MRRMHALDAHLVDDRDGAAPDLHQLHRALGHLPGFASWDEIERLVALCDVNGDGLVDMREWGDALPEEQQRKLKQWITETGDIVPERAFQLRVA